MPEGICSIDGCQKPRAYAYTGYCMGHHSRFLKHGSPGDEPLRIRGGPKPICVVDGCEQVAVAKGMCPKHRHRVVTWGDADYVPSRRGKYAKGDDITIWGAHDRVRSRFGLPSQHLCQCGQPATTWAYDHLDPNEKDGGRLGPYSVNPDHYQPMCWSCHKRMDLAYLASKASA